MVDRPTQRENIEREIACFSLCDLCVCMVAIGGGIAIVAELFKIQSLPFAVGVYLPVATMTPIFLGGMLKKVLKQVHPDFEIGTTGLRLMSDLIAWAVDAILAAVPASEDADRFATVHTNAFLEDDSTKKVLASRVVPRDEVLVHHADEGLTRRKEREPARFCPQISQIVPRPREGHATRPSEVFLDQNNRQTLRLSQGAGSAQPTN